jgi:hypothetical protein
VIDHWLLAVAGDAVAGYGSSGEDGSIKSQLVA